MRSRVTLVVLALVLIGALLQVLRLRFESNDLLPEYSSQGSDPNGLSVLFEALKTTGALPLSRSNRPLAMLNSGDATLVVAGVDRFGWLDSESNMGDMEALAVKGNRVVIAMSRSLNRYEKESPQEPLRAKWDVRVLAQPDDASTRWPAYLQSSADWQVLESDHGRALVIERTFGSGSVVLLASTWPLTNEAMVQDRRSEMLSALFSAKPRIIFDESHLGLEQSGSVMALSRTFHLQGFLLGLVLLAGVFVWRNLSGFPPERALPARRTGRDSLSGLSILLARNVPEKNLIDTCLAERQKCGEKRLTRTQFENASFTAGKVLERFEAIRQGLHKS